MISGIKASQIRVQGFRSLDNWFRRLFGVGLLVALGNLTGSWPLPLNAVERYKARKLACEAFCCPVLFKSARSNVGPQFDVLAVFAGMRAKPSEFVHHWWEFEGLELLQGRTACIFQKSSRNPLQGRQAAVSTDLLTKLGVALPLPLLMSATAMHQPRSSVAWEGFIRSPGIAKLSNKLQLLG